MSKLLEASRRSVRKRAQQVAQSFPVTTPGDWDHNRYHHLDRGFRVAVVIDATPWVPEGWPCWHVTAVYGEMIDGIARPAVPLSLWSRKVRKMAPQIIAANLSNRGDPETELIVSVQEMKDGAYERGLQPPCGISGRRALTHEETRLVFADNWGAVERINPTFAALVEEEPIYKQEYELEFKPN